ncbi:MAG: CehA/McbA family metallohydrolase [Pseudomonadota bacterium]|nr:CehA/McbA family metallohydrolase [Pseudomonadota bacterium]
MLFQLLACTDVPPDKVPDAVPPDLTERLGSGEVRAGVITDVASLFGGISAEGAVGDLKLYNDRVQFVIQGVGDSGYYVEYGGGLIDADIVRAEGIPGRDMVDEITPMIGLGRVVDATSVTVLADGSDGSATIRVEGPAAPMQLITGALESPSVVPDLDLRVRTDYTLAPDAWALSATTTVWSEEGDPIDLYVGQVALMATDVAEGWRPVSGRSDETDAEVDIIGAVSVENEVAFVMAGADGPLESGSVGRILGAIVPALLGFGPTTTVAPGDSVSWSSWLGVGPDIATLTGEHLGRGTATTQTVAGTVTAGGSPVAGARVHVLDGDGAPLSLAFTDATGAWSATVPAGPVSFVASGRGRSLQMDLPEGAGWYSPYDADPTVTLASLAAGAEGPPFAEGYGLSAAGTDTNLVLTAPGTLRVTVADGGSAIVYAAWPAGDPVVADTRLVPDRPNGYAAIGFIRDGEMDLALEPGTYDVVVYRGVRDELVRASVTVASGETVPLLADIVPAYTLDGFITIDPHSHASPSSDASISMADRLIVAAANGVDVHVGTDHDHTVDYRPLLAPLGLDQRLVSVVATEVSPVLRGHFNTWPGTVTPGATNGGAPRWWFGYVDTAEIFGWLREMVGEDGIIQANHPVGSSGMFSLANYDANGNVDTPDHWSDDFDAMELLNSGDWADNLPFYLDLVARGRVVTPVGVSDSHAHMSGQVGLNVTFLHTGTTLAGVNDDVLRAAMHERGTVVSFGPFIDARVGGEWAPGATVASGSVLTVDVRAPSWMPVETVTLYEDGVAIATEACIGAAPTPCTVSWPLAPTADAFYVVIAASTTLVMEGAHPGNLAWAATAATFVDVDSDGWTPPRAPIEFGG